MDEPLIRRKRSKGFTTVYNSVLQDKRLSLKTIGLFAIMQSFPETWEYSVSGLSARVSVCKDTIRACLRELEKSGYLTRLQTRDKNGAYGKSIYTLLDESPTAQGKARYDLQGDRQSPTDDRADFLIEKERGKKEPLTEKPSTAKKVPEENPSTVNPSTVNPTQVNKHKEKETLSNILPPIAPQKGAKEIPPTTEDLFNQFWAIYPRKQNKAKASKEWGKLSPDIHLFSKIERAISWQKKTKQWTQKDGQFIPLPSSWLSARRWEDEPPETFGPGGEPAQAAFGSDFKGLSYSSAETTCARSRSGARDDYVANTGYSDVSWMKKYIDMRKKEE